MLTEQIEKQWGSNFSNYYWYFCPCKMSSCCQLHQQFLPSASWVKTKIQCWYSSSCPASGRSRKKEKNTRGGGPAAILVERWPPCNVSIHNLVLCISVEDRQGHNRHCSA